MSKRDFSGRNLSPKTLHIICAINAVTTVCAIVLSVFFIYYQVYDLGVAMLAVVLICAYNVYKFWPRKTGLR